ncbi:MAG: hypothetical protein ACRD0Z_13975 [Acidimicrobiales bacterium]
MPRSAIGRRGKRRSDHALAFAKRSTGAALQFRLELAIDGDELSCEPDTARPPSVRDAAAAVTTVRRSD